MEDITFDVRKLEDSVFDEFIKTSFEPYMRKKKYSLEDNLRYDRCSMNEPFLSVKFQYTTAAGVLCDGWLLIKNFGCVLQVGRGDYRYNPELSELWRNQMSNSADFGDIYKSEYEKYQEIQETEDSTKI